MNVYFHFLGYCRPTRRDARKAARIARRHGAEFVELAVPGNRTRWWFESQDDGHRKRATTDAIVADLEAEGVVLQ